MNTQEDLKVFEAQLEKLLNSDNPDEYWEEITELRWIINNIK